MYIDYNQAPLPLLLEYYVTYLVGVGALQQLSWRSYELNMGLFLDLTLRGCDSCSYSTSSHPLTNHTLAYGAMLEPLLFSTCMWNIRL